MKKIVYLYFVLILSLLACTRIGEVMPENAAEALQEDGAPDGTVKISFTCTMPESFEDTKSLSLGEESDLTSMHLAVFGSSGYYKEYVPATLTKRAEKEERTFKDANGNPFTKMVDCYDVTVELKLSNTPRTIHFLGNGPKTIKIGKAQDVLPKLLCNDPEDDLTKETAFWQMIWVPAIEAKTNDDGEYLNPQGNVRQPGEDYKVSPITLAYFQDIALIRNWAKISLRNNWQDETPDYELDPTGQTYGFSNFEPHSFAVINYPTRGSFVPYGGKTGFIGPVDKDTQDRHYQLLGFDELYYSEKPPKATVEYGFYYGYKGNLPEGAPFNRDIPSADDFENGTGGVKLYDRRFQDDVEGNLDPDLEPAVYLYERPVPTGSVEPTYVLIYGKYKNPKDPSLSEEEKETGVNCYYKIDLMDGKDYYPIFRNFKYQVFIRKITSRGYDNPRSAAESAGSANVSADVTASHLADISDGKKRMAIDPWMSYTFIDGDPDKDDDGNPITELPTHLYVKFLDDITTDPPVLNTKAASITYELIPENGGVIVDDVVEIGSPATHGSEYGWRPIKFKVNKPDASVSRTQTLRIKCQTDPDDLNELPLYRDIVMTLQSKQTMKVACRDKKVLRDIGIEQEVDISIPSGLVESMFPLIFTIEPQEMTLTAALTTTAEGEEVSMPVVYGGSVNPLYQDPDDPSKVTKTRFQFERTVTWAEYNAQRTVIDEYDESRWKTFPCLFKTNCESSATEIWVANKYFNPANCSFSDFRSFKNPRYTTSIPKKMLADIPVSFGIFKELDAYGNYVYPKVYLKLEGLKWDGHTLDNGVYSYTPTDNNPSTQTQEETLTFQTTTDNGKISVTLYTDGYEPVVLKPWRFSNVGFIQAHALPNNWNGDWGSNVIFGMANKEGNKNFPLCFTTDPGNSTPKIVYKQVDNNPTNINRTELDVSKLNIHAAPYAGRDDYYWDANMKGVAGDTPVWFIMSAVGYVEEEVKANRFYGSIKSLRLAETNLTSKFKNQARNSGRIEVQDRVTANGLCWAELEIYDDNGAGPLTSANGLVLERGKTYNVIVKILQKNGNNFDPASDFELASVQFEYYRESVNPGDSMDPGIPQTHLDYDIISPAEDNNESSFYQYMGTHFQYVWDFPRGNNKGQIQLRAPNNRDAVIQVIRIWEFYDKS